jgi:hypothetical protein
MQPIKPGDDKSGHFEPAKQEYGLVVGGSLSQKFQFSEFIGNNANKGWDYSTKRPKNTPRKKQEKKTKHGENNQLARVYLEQDKKKRRKK